MGPNRAKNRKDYTAEYQWKITPYINPFGDSFLLACYHSSTRNDDDDDEDAKPRRDLQERHV
jgi:hypothetical protein